jgi:uncharacterized membrane protein (UPF0127 family)
MKHRHLLTIGIIFLLAIIVTIVFNQFHEEQESPNFSTTKSTPTQKIKSISIGDKILNVELATTPNEWQAGLSNRPSLDSNAGMLFIFPVSEMRNFWMKDTLIPLDIIWVNNNTVIGIDRMFPEPTSPEFDLKRYYSPSESNAVIEVNSNWTINNNIKIGDIVSY